MKAFKILLIIILFALGYFVLTPSCGLGILFGLLVLSLICALIFGLIVSILN